MKTFLHSPPVRFFAGAISIVAVAAALLGFASQPLPVQAAAPVSVAVAPVLVAVAPPALPSTPVCYESVDAIQVVDVAGHYTCSGGEHLVGTECYHNGNNHDDGPATWVATTYKTECPEGSEAHAGGCRIEVACPPQTILAHHFLGNGTCQENQKLPSEVDNNEWIAGACPSTPPVCDDNASVVNGSCVCDSGYTGDGQTCTLITSACPNGATNPPVCDKFPPTCGWNASIVDEACTCNTGFTGDPTVGCSAIASVVCTGKKDLVNGVCVRRQIMDCNKNNNRLYGQKTDKQEALRYSDHHGFCPNQWFKGYHWYWKEHPELLERRPRGPKQH